MVNFAVWLVFLLSDICQISPSIIPQKRIIEGRDSTEPRLFFVSIAGLTPAGDWGVCGGTIVSQNCIVTAAHCAKSKLSNINYRDRAPILVILKFGKGKYSPNFGQKIKEAVFFWTKICAMVPSVS